MNSIARIIWFLLNLLLGAAVARILFDWGACDMQMPLIYKNLISAHLPILNPIFNVPYVQINRLSSSVVAKLIFNGFLYAIFGFSHTFFAQEFVQATLARFLFPKQTLRTVYCIIVTVTAFIIMGFWQHTGIQLWNWLPSTMNNYQQQLVLLITYHIIFAPGWYVIIKFNLFEFGGLKQIFSRIESAGCPYSLSANSETRTTGTANLVTSGLFRYCRHPLYFVTILAWVLTPVMSLDHFVLVIYTCLYVLIGIPFEERKLVQIFGPAYVDYQQRVPAIMPRFTSKTKKN
ncbi:unnamed protein product [Rotaria magnacalcarata]|uniref:Nuclear envelope membrane protein n=1 Tax=Rotaria magnacalcarata TaxID=392030 RepID=A0A816UQ88_9BILA|nr:unnamed protein product [Rotaria magnacalcarata]CAF4318034.1 unnamed protein product [Rotaria magnacalcarata]